MKLRYVHEAVDWFAGMVDVTGVEQFGVAGLDKEHNLVGHVIVSVGENDHVKVDPRTVFRFGLECGAAALLVIHNHPGGKLRPSSRDRELAYKLATLGRMLCLRVVSQIVVAPPKRFMDYGITYER